MKSTSRALVALATGALALPIIATPASAVVPEPPATQSIAQLCANVPASYDPFTDDNGNTFVSAIECIAFAEITSGGPQGRPATQYGPELRVNRDSMATFIVAMMDTADELDTGDNIEALPAYDGTPAFTDVTPSNVHFEAINRLEQVGIVSGGPGGQPATSYGPGLGVTRAQMASFINGAIAFMLGGEPEDAGVTSGYTTANDYFTDDDGSVHEANINGIASEGIATGDGVDSYQPGRTVNRDAMAAFLIRSLAVLEEDDLVAPLPPKIVVTPDSEATHETTPNPDSTTADDRSYTASGLVAGQEYRITLVREGQVTRNADGEDVFAEDGTTGLAATGSPTADITTVNGQAAQNNTGDGTARTTNPAGNSPSAVVTAPADGTVTFVVDGDAAGESVRPVVYRNGGPGNTDEDGGQSPRLELDDDGTAAEEYDLGGVTNFVAPSTDTDLTDAPDLVSVTYVRTTTVGGTPVSTYRYTFDEPVTATVTEADFHLYRFDRTEVTRRATDGADAQRDSSDERSVLVLFNVSAEQTADITVGTVDEGAVSDSDANANPIGDAPVGSGVSFTGGRTAAPDVVSIGNFRPGPANGTTSTVLVDYTFDEAAFVVNPAAGQFQLISSDGRQNNGAPVEATSGFQGDGTTTITVTFDVVEANGPISSTVVVRGVVLAGTVSDTAQVANPAPVTGADPVEGVVNPLQVTDANGGGTTTLPDLQSVSLDQAARTVTYVFDEAVTGAAATEFQVYDRNGTETPGSSIASATGATVVVSFAGSTLDDVTGASVDGGAVTGTADPADRANQDDELPLTASGIAAGHTTGPDLVRAERELETVTTTDPFTGEQTTEVTGVTIRYVFDDDAAAVADGFFVVTEDGTSTEITATCEQVDQGANANVVECTIPAEDDVPIPTDESAAFDEAQAAVVATVDNGAVTDGEGTANPEGAARLG